MSVETARLGEALATPAANDAADRDWTLSLLGGPVYRAGRRLHLVMGLSNTVPMGFVTGISLWLALMVAAAFNGLAGSMFAVPVLSFHVRALIVLPLLFVCETWLDPQVGAAIRALKQSHVIPVEEQPALLAFIARVTRWKDSALPDVICFVITLLLWSVEVRLPRFGADATIRPGMGALDHPGMIALHFALVVTVFRFVLLRFLWRLALWWICLFRLSRFKLRLVPSHPDRAGGLGQLELVQFQFLPLVGALSMFVAATYAEELAKGSVSFSVVYSAAATSILAGMIVVFAPLLIFAPALKRSREAGYAAYMIFASRYVNAFEQRWIATGSEEDLLGTGDIQSLADLSNSVGVVRQMRMIPAGPILLIQTVVVALAPMLPLVLFQQSVPDLLQKLLGRLVLG